MKKIFILILVSLLFGCVHQNTFKDENLALVVEGKTTKTEVEKIFGKPSTKNTDFLGNELWLYTLSGDTSDNVIGDTFIRVLSQNSFDGIQHNMGNTDTLVISFKEGVVIRKTRTTNSQKHGVSTYHQKN